MSDEKGLRRLSFIIQTKRVGWLPVAVTACGLPDRWTTMAGSITRLLGFRRIRRLRRLLVIVSLCGLYQDTCKLENIIDVINLMSGDLLLFVKCAEVLLSRIEIQPAKRFAIVVVEKNAAIALGIPNEHTLSGNNLSNN